MDIHRIGDFTLTWGESLVWDEQRSRLYFVDTLGMAVHWLDDGSDELHSLTTPQMPSGMVMTRDGRGLVVTMDDGLYVVEPDLGDITQLTPYPSQLDGRCNDMCADLEGNLITGKLNLGPAEGSSWWYSPSAGWRLIDDDISNTNGPTVATLDGAMTLVIGDSSKDYFAYDYEPATGTVGPRRLFGAMDDLDGSKPRGIPDGATLDDQDGLWCALPGRGELVRFTAKGYDRTIEVPFEHPTDVTFGGADLDRLYVVAINEGLYVVDGVGRGRVEPRAAV